MPVRLCWVQAAISAAFEVAAGLVTSTVRPQGQPVAS